TIEEKSNRLMEVLLSSISPRQLMAGKIVGIGCTGLTVVGSWVLVTIFAAKFLIPRFGAPAGVNLASIAGDPLLLASFLVYFLLGYFFYAAILVAIGSMCNTMKEAQNLMGPVTILLIVPLFLMLP